MSVDLYYALRYPGECSGTVTVNGEQDACRKPAIGIRLDPEDEGRAWPCCVGHARVGRMVTLTDILAATAGPRAS